MRCLPSGVWYIANALGDTCKVMQLSEVLRDSEGGLRGFVGGLRGSTRPYEVQRGTVQPIKPWAILKILRVLGVYVVLGEKS